MIRVSVPCVAFGALLMSVACGPQATTGGSGGATTETGGKSGATGGAPVASGGAGPGTGGIFVGTGGTTGTGGRTVETGGATAQGGRASGGTTSAGTGGATGTGGRMTGTGGATGAGGRATGGGGATGAGGRAAGGGAGGSTTGGAGGCVPKLACKLTAPASTGNLYQDCVDRINQFLTQCACLPALARATEGEACADQMAAYDAGQDSAHAGFKAKICKPSGSQNECPGYSSNSQVIGLCMQQMWDEGPPPAGTCTGTCYETHGHYINMTDKSVHKVACGFFTTSAGKVWAVQNFL